MSTVADPDLELRGGPGSVLLALLVVSLFIQNKGVAPGAPPLDPSLVKSPGIRETPVYRSNPVIGRSL